MCYTYLLSLYRYCEISSSSSSNIFKFVRPKTWGKGFLKKGKKSIMSNIQ